MSHVNLRVRTWLGVALPLLLTAVGCTARPATTPDPRTAGPTAPSTSPASPGPAEPRKPSSEPERSPSRPTTDPRQIYFSQVDRVEPVDPEMEITTIGQIDTFHIGPPAVTTHARAAVEARLGPGTRIFAFAFEGCGNLGARLRITAKQITAYLVDGMVTCMVPEFYFAVFAVPTAQVPAGARIP
jgi:hypothetical protein